MSCIKTRPPRVLAIAAIALGAGTLLSVAAGHDTGTASPATIPPATTAVIEVAKTAPLALVKEVDSLAPAPAPASPALLAGTVPLDEATQKMVYGMCGENDALFCTVMAVAGKESQFNPDAVGDGGGSIGMMQINTYWQRDRIAALGVTDLTDIGQNMAVALDYIDWLAGHIEPDAPETAYGTGRLFMAYNYGLAGAKKAWAGGVTETGYSRECLRYFQTFMAEMEGTE